MARRSGSARNEAALVTSEARSASVGGVFPRRAHGVSRCVGGDETQTHVALGVRRSGAQSPLPDKESRLHAENVHFQACLGDDGGIKHWSRKLLADVQVESDDERRIFCLKSQLCLAVRRRKQLEEAVRSRHAALERLAGCNLEEVVSNSERIDQLLCEGVAAVGANTGTRRQQATARRNMLTMEGSFEAEQHLAELLETWKETATESATVGAHCDSELEILVKSCASALLESACQLPPAPAQQAAVARRQLRRELGAGPKLNALMSANVPRKLSGSEFIATADLDMAGVCNCDRVQVGHEQLHPMKQGHCAAHLSDELHLAWRNCMQAAADEQEHRSAVECWVARTAELVAQWALYLQFAHTGV